MALTLMKGSEAIAEAAIRAGARYFFGYPITPQTEIPEYMSERMPEVGGCFLQAESEVAAINMIYGAAGTGARALTSSSSPGVSLKQEGISYCAGAQLPCVILNVMRGGPGLGNIQASQGDYFQAVKGGGNGDYHLLTYAPASVQEAIDIMMFAFDKAEKYRIPVLFLADGIIAQMMEPVEMPEMVDFKIDPEKKPWACTGWKPGDDPAKRGVINSIYIDTESLSEHNAVLQACYKEVVANEQMWEEYNLEGAEFVITAFGTVARIAKSAIDELKEEGINVGLVRPITVWPFPYDAVKKAASAEGVKAVLDVELNEGQMLEDVKLAVNGAKDVDFFGHLGSEMPTTEEIKAKIISMKEGK
ncbi:MAG: 3-methyl-2-oxobutanoate dehydrogenase subunit VorB [Oscillospiraceae bacterium]|nr:3-methyl-2-oxobutanoate dehydrogenase subunit VorB [Clostridiales bacterium]MDD6936247.1 3-methyl-2-oxobutanoate dehydrogenase subunit VorB [Clostridiales bacterium]MDY2961900.1 3-methyl-2-oxobutanoate dehydrogenase subunit VorB [Oscillospiraceae bacterium]MDY5595036.1 3-methyl-2-oxobutanoate dehydrogenase subunit VorB [Oscillospiraceae bacterium]MDY6095621.1 3-methyl-2-oxobutanoate dehydrogenase subunit VorB [Oscillospiraceae bacterium]